MENKSAKRQALVIRLKDHPYFEEAHMIYKNSLPENSENDMVKEATRIIAAYEPKKSKEKGRIPKKHSSLFYFVCGMFSSLFLFFCWEILLFLLK